MRHQDGRQPRTDHNAEAQRALYALIAGAEGCGTAARSARVAQDEESTDFLCRAERDNVGEARRLLERRVAE